MDSKDGMIDDKKASIQALADSVIANRDKPGAVWDADKAKELVALSGKYIYDEKTRKIELKPGFVEGGQSATGSGAGGTVGGTGGGGAGGNSGNNANSADFAVPRGGTSGGGSTAGGGSPIIIPDNPSADFDALRGGRR